MASRTTASPLKEKAPRVRRDGRPRLTTEVARLFPLQGQWTEYDYFALPETNHLVELSEGRLVMLEMPSAAHQHAVAEIFVAMHSYIHNHELGEVLIAPLPVRLWPGKVREPDIVFMSAAHADRRGEEFWGVPDLAVEVVSPRTERSSGTEHVDRGEKFLEYARAGVSEYWLVDPEGRTVEVYVLRQGVYHLLGKWGSGEVACSEVLTGFEVAVAVVVRE